MVRTFFGCYEISFESMVVLFEQKKNIYKLETCDTTEKIQRWRKDCK